MILTSSRELELEVALPRKPPKATSEASLCTTNSLVKSGNYKDWCNSQHSFDEVESCMLLRIPCYRESMFLVKTCSCESDEGTSDFGVSSGKTPGEIHHT